MDSLGWLVIAVIIVAAVAAGLWYMSQRRRSTTLRQRFGNEYERAVEQHGDRRKAELDLERREKRIEQLHIRPLSREEQDRFADAWRGVQARFVDNPGAAIGDADRLISDVMKARGYPVGDHEQRAADLSVEHSRVVERYRTALAIVERHRGGQADTEDLRNAMMHYRSLYEHLIGERVHVAGRSPEVNL
jgi:hypothetical protein